MRDIITIYKSYLNCDNADYTTLILVLTFRLNPFSTFHKPNHHYNNHYISYIVYEQRIRTF